MRERLRRRLFMLWILELLNGIVVFPGLTILFARMARFKWYSFAATGMVSLILIIGGIYWLLKYRSLKGDGSLQRTWVAAVYRGTKLILPIMIAGFVPLFVIATLTGGNAADLIYGTLMAGFAGLEYVNYYHWQLSYDNMADIRYLIENRKLKRGILKREPAFSPDDSIA